MRLVERVRTTAINPPNSYQISPQPFLGHPIDESSCSAGSSAALAANHWDCFQIVGNLEVVRLDPTGDQENRSKISLVPVEYHSWRVSNRRDFCALSDREAFPNAIVSLYRSGGPTESSRQVKVDGP
jgi:hypothetical protein